MRPIISFVSLAIKRAEHPATPVQIPLLPSLKIRLPPSSSIFLWNVASSVVPRGLRSRVAAAGTLEAKPPKSREKARFRAPSQLASKKWHHADRSIAN